MSGQPAYVPTQPFQDGKKEGSRFTIEHNEVNLSDATLKFLDKSKVVNRLTMEGFLKKIKKINQSGGAKENF